MDKKQLPCLFLVFGLLFEGGASGATVTKEFVDEVQEFLRTVIVGRLAAHVVRAVSRLRR